MLNPLIPCRLMNFTHYLNLGSLVTLLASADSSGKGMGYEKIRWE